ncbi:hypothetical protein ACFQ7N_39515 [Streptomyces niveus]|uniref:hypothetical protein n=1 Tax=Streptomyces niveus TaxID=193462 RepID=UPI003699C8D8
MADTEEKTMLPEVSAYVAALDAAEDAYRTALGISGPINCCAECSSDRPFSELVAAGSALREARSAANTALHEAQDPLVRWIARNADGWPTECDTVLRALPATLGELDTLAKESGWCGVWAELRDRAIDAGVVPGVPKLTARMRLDRYLKSNFTSRAVDELTELVDALLLEQQEAQVSA